MRKPAPTPSCAGTSSALISRRSRSLRVGTRPPSRPAQVGPHRRRRSQLPATAPPGVKAAVHSGRVVRKVAYSDGSDGVLIVSCDLPVGSPPTLFEGITASKGYIDYWERDPAVGGVDANRTNFHTLHSSH